MGKTIRHTYPAKFSIGFLILIFIISSFLSQQIFDLPFKDTNLKILLGMILAGLAVIIMILIVWEEFMFPIKVKEMNGGFLFKNHRNKLKTQLLIYCTIPAIFIFIYFNYPLNYIRFFIWALICISVPVFEKIGSGINNYNDYLFLSSDKIEYKDNEKEGSFPIKDIENIIILKDSDKILSKILLLFSNQTQLTIDLDKMELDAFLNAIMKYITSHYQGMVKEDSISE